MAASSASRDSCSRVHSASAQLESMKLRSTVKAKSPGPLAFWPFGSSAIVTFRKSRSSRK
jgi:hypothetical protein